MKKTSISRIILIVFGFISMVFIAEYFLKLNSWIYRRISFKKNHSERIYNELNTYKFLFVGDSWTEGGEAPPGKGFPEQLVCKLGAKENSFLKSAWASSNSSQAVLQLLKEIRNNNFKYVFVLTGSNNGWNADEVDTVTRFAYETFGWPPIGRRSHVDVLSRMGFYRLGRLFRIFKQTKYLKAHENFSTHDRGYLNMYWEFLAELNDHEDSVNMIGTGAHRIRELLIEHRSEAKDYNEFYHAIKLSFNNRHSLTEEFLKFKNLWKPKLIKNLDNEVKYEEFLRIHFDIARRDLKLIIEVCREKQIEPILQTYPSPWASFNTINNLIRKVSYEEGVSLIDHERLFFNKNKKAEDFIAHFAKHHPNERGYALIAENIYEFLSNKEKVTAQGSKRKT